MKDFAKIFRTKKYGQILVQRKDDYSKIWVTARFGKELLSIEVSEDDNSSLEKVFEKMNIESVKSIIGSYLKRKKSYVIWLN